MESSNLQKCEQQQIDFKQLLSNITERSNFENEIQNSLTEKGLNPDTDYYQECCKLYIANVILTTQLKELITEKNQMQSKLEKYEKKNESSELEKSKRHRRTAQEIQRNFICPIESCKNAEASLTQHLKLKHPNEYFKIMQNCKPNQDNNENNNLGDNNSEDSQLKHSIKKEKISKSN